MLATLNCDPNPLLFVLFRVSKSSAAEKVVAGDERQNQLGYDLLWDLIHLNYNKLQNLSLCGAFQK